MQPERWRRIEALLDAAFDRPEAEREESASQCRRAGIGE
jgi:hypothetical protein